MENIESVLYLISTLFFYPVLMGLMILLGKTCFELGAFLRTYWKRLRQPRIFRIPYEKRLKIIAKTAADRALELALQQVLEDAERDSSGPIQTARYSIKMGPTLGLIGTLTPMARALSGLAEGNLHSLSGQMIAAFSTTVIGLVVGGIAFSIAHVRAKWQKEDLYTLAYEAEGLLGRAETSN